MAGLQSERPRTKADDTSLDDHFGEPQILLQLPYNSYIIHVLFVDRYGDVRDLKIMAII